MIAPQEKLYGHMDRLIQVREFGQSSAPVNIEIDLSNRCSLGCEWCHFAHTHTRGPLAGKTPKPADAISGGDLMPTSLALDIVRQAAELGVRSLTWTGGGEATLHPDFDQIIGYAAQLGIKQGLYTHGGHITDDRAKLLKKACTFVYVSLDAVDADSYKQAKGLDRFDDACAGIRRLARAKGDATVGVGFLVTQSNYQDVSEAGFLAERLGADYLQVRPTVRFEVNEPGFVAEDTFWINDAVKTIAKAAYYQSNISADLDRFAQYRDWQGHEYNTCFWSTLQTVITPNGRVWRCVNKREFADALLGDLAVESLRDVWDRASATPVDRSCRVMCRGDAANRALDTIMRPLPHAEFV